MNSDHRREVDPERREPKNAFDHDQGISGQSYSKEREAALRNSDPSGAVNADPAEAGEGAGARASIDPRTGEARGSGADAAADPQLKPNAAAPEEKGPEASRP